MANAISVALPLPTSSSSLPSSATMPPTPMSAPASASASAPAPAPAPVTSNSATTSHSHSHSHPQHSPNPISGSNSNFNPTTTSGKRSWDPNATNILWAHELRRENIQTANQMDSLQAILATANKSIATLHESIGILTTRITDLEDEREVEPVVLKSGDGDGYATTAITAQQSEEIEQLRARIRAVEERAERAERAEQAQRGGATEKESEQVRRLAGSLKGLEERGKAERVAFEKRIKDLEEVSNAKVQGILEKVKGVEKANSNMEKKNATHWDLSKTQAELLDRIASANDVLDEKIGGQKKEINELSGRVKTQNAGFKDLSGKVETQDTEMKTLIEKVDALEKENQMLREKTDALHSENTKFRDSFNKLEQASERVLAASRESDERNAAADAGGRIPRGHKRRRSREGSDEDQDQETRIPNSMPTPTSRRSNRGSTQRTATDTTLGSLSDLDGSYSSRTPSNRQSRRVSAEAKEDLVKLQQEGRTLQAYLSLAIDLRSRRAGTSDKPWVSAFITGLNDRQIAQRLERDVPEVLYSSPNLAWDAMRIAVENIIAAEGVRKQESVDEIARDNTSGKSGTKKKDAKRKRRSLAIVPLDDEDVVFVAR